MNSNWQKTEKVAALCALIWFATIIDACYTWLIPTLLCYFIGLPFVVYATILLSQKKRLIVTEQRMKMFVPFFCLFIYLLITKASLFSFIKFPLLYSPLFCLFFWPRSVLIKFYIYIKRFIVFYAIVSILVEVLVLSGVWTKLPYIILPPQDNVQEISGTVNRFYGFFVIPESIRGVTFYRAMGPLREGGHFSIFLGFVYFIEKTVFDKRNIWIVVAGLLSLSPNFVFFSMITESYMAIKHKRIYKTVIGFICAVTIVMGVIWFSPGYIKDEIVRIVLERSLEENIENAGTNGYMELLDGRTNIEGIRMWNHFVKHADSFTKLTGLSNSEFREQYVLSDFRSLILRYGYLGLFLILICSVSISRVGKKGLYGICVLLFCLWVMISRAWMFNMPYIWIMMYLAINAKIVQDSNFYFAYPVAKVKNTQYS